MHTCLDQYKANKATGGNGGLAWIQKCGGYYSECSKRLGSGVSLGRPRVLLKTQVQEPLNSPTACGTPLSPARSFIIWCSTILAAVPGVRL